MNIRQARLPDIPELSHLWQHKMALLQQTDQSIRLLPKSQTQWETAASQWLDATHYGFFVAEYRSTIIGFIVGYLQKNLPGLAPPQLGTIAEFVTDIHSTNPRLARGLVMRVRAWFEAKGVSDLVVCVPIQSAVEQAFWRSMGAIPRKELFWMK